MRNVIFDETKIFDDDIETARLELKQAQTAQNMNLEQLVKLLQQLNKTETTRQPKPDRLSLDDDVDDDNIIMLELDNTDSDDLDFVLDSNDSYVIKLCNE